MTEKPTTNRTDVTTGDDPMIGTIVASKYEIFSALGRGAWSAVYLAKHRELGSPVAIKLLDTGFAPTEEILRRFEREAKTVSSLNHPAIVFVFDYGVKPSPYIVMEYLEGKTLAEILKADGAMPWKVALPIFQQLCDGLEAAHNRGVIHRDIKPGNVMICSNADGRLSAKILDFGIAKIATGAEDDYKTLTATEQMLGSPPYMSPEQCLRQPLDARSDIYSLGCLMFEVLTGKLAFEGRSQMEIMRKHLEGVPPDMVAANPAARIPAAFEDTVARCLAHSASDRYQTASELKADLALVLEGKKKTGGWSLSRPHQIKRAAVRFGICLAILAPIALAVMLITVWRHPTLEKLWQWSYDLGLSQMAQKNYQQSRQIFSMASGIADALGPLDRRKLQTEIKLAEAYSLEGRLIEADRIARQVILNKRGNPSAQWLHAVDKAQALMSQKDYLQAEPLLKQALTEANLLDGGHNLLAAQCYAGLAGVYLATGQLDRAEELGRRALSLREELLDPDDVQLAYSYNDLGAILNNEKRYEEARPLLETALAIAKNHQSGKDILRLDEGDAMYREDADATLVAAVHDNLATAASNLGERFRAERAIQEDIANLKNSTRYNDREMSVAYASLGKIMMETDRLDASDEMYREAAAIEGYRHPHPDGMAYVLYNWGLLRARQGRFSESYDMMKRSLSLAEKIVPTPSLFINRVRDALAKVDAKLKSSDQTAELTKPAADGPVKGWLQTEIKQMGFLQVTAFQARQIYRYPDLNELECLDPSAVDADLAGISKLTKLWAVTLNQAAISGATVQRLSRLPLLTWVWLETKSVDDHAIAQLKSDSVKYLSLNHSSVGSAGAARIARDCPNVESLGLDDTLVDDQCLSSLATLKRLKFINVSSTRVSDQGLLTLLNSHSLIMIKKSQSSVEPRIRKQLTDGGIIVLDQQWFSEHPSCEFPGLNWQSPILHLCLTPNGQTDIRGH